MIGGAIALFCQLYEPSNLLSGALAMDCNAAPG